MINGMINIKKEKGYTSHDVVAKLRGIVGQRKIGHTGTLDPDATGVLPVCLGKATKLCDMLTDKNKTYEAVLLLGMETDTQDITGEVLATAETTALSEEEVTKAILSFVGKYDQIPPMYSALKVDGKKLYELAREGKVIERKSREVTILDINILEINLPEVRMSVTCSKGTYIRTLCYDIGQKLSVGGCMKELIRTKVSCFEIENALTLSEVQALKEVGELRSCIQSLDSVFEELDAWILPEEMQWLAWNGNKLDVSPYVEDVKQISSWSDEQKICVYDRSKRFIGVYKYMSEIHTLKLEKMFLDKDELLPKSAITLGKFDGFHRGHQKLLNKVSEYSNLEGENPIESVVFAFDMSQFKKRQHLPCEQLMLKEERVQFLDGKVDKFIECEFDKAIRTMKAERFISQILVEKYRARYIVVGSDFRFGFEASGDVALLKQYENLYEYEVIEIEKETYNGNEISSTYIKNELAKGHIQEANQMLGYIYSISGTVIHGRKLGRTIGFPTMNIIPETDKVLPKNGVYIVEVTIDGKVFKGIANIGNKPTVHSDGEVLVETYVFDYEDDAYGKEICVSFVEFIREETKFSSVDLLKDQIGMDLENARKILFTS